MSQTTAGPKKARDTGRTDRGAVPEGPWETDWRNVVRRRQEGLNQVSEYTLQKRKSRHLARERDIGRQRAANLLKHGDVDVPDEEVL